MTDTPNENQAAEEQGAGAENETRLVERRPAWFAPAVACGIAAFVLLLLLLPGILIFPGSNTSLTDNNDLFLELQRENNKGLENEIAELKRSLEFGVCTRDGNFYPQTPRVPGEPGQPGQPGEPLRPLEGIPPAPDSLAPEGDALPSDREFSGSMLDLIDQGVVAVWADKGADAGMGTGFWVAPGIVMTNSHVIEGSSEIYVASKALNTKLRAELVAAEPLNANVFPERDFAILRIADAPDTIVPLSFAPHRRGQNVMASGFPGYLLKEEVIAFFSDRSPEPPAPATTEGMVNLKKENGDPAYMIHSASIAPGNSGGPLVDYCGRAVGVNTWMRQVQEKGVFLKSDLALSGLDAVAYLQANGVTPRLVNDECDPSRQSEESTQAPESDEQSDGSDGGNAEEAEE